MNGRELDHSCIFPLTVLLERRALLKFSRILKILHMNAKTMLNTVLGGSAVMSRMYLCSVFIREFGVISSRREAGCRKSCGFVICELALV